MTLRTGDRLGPYEILALLGAGGMGEVYRAHDPRLGRDVAIKVLPAEYSADSNWLRRFKQEARAIAVLDHPNILVIHDIGTHEDAPYLVTELLEGETIGERLEGGPLPIRKAVEIGVQIAKGLAAAHEKGIIHRDLKPANLFVTKGNHVKILDFGVAKLSLVEQGKRKSSEMTAATEAAEGGAALGTVGYVSPEQLRGQPVDYRADIFSFGCVLYEMLSGRKAFVGETPADTIASVLGGDPAPLDNLGGGFSPALQAILRRCLEKRPEDRFSSAHDLALALNAITEAVVSCRAPFDVTAKSIVVLPFENLSPDPENGFFSDGLTEELIADLSKLRSLRVISRTSAMLLKGSKKDVPTIARELNVRYVLEGSVRRAGKSLRITAQLIDAANDAHLWAEKYSGTLDDVFAIQEKVSGSIVDALKLTLTADERHRLAARMIPDVKAFDLYLQARREAYQRMTEDALDHAVRLIHQAIDLVGPNAILYSVLAEVEWLYHDQGIRHDEASLRHGESWARKALELDPETATAFQALGAIEARRGDMVSAIRNLKRANELQVSGETLTFLAWRCSEVGRMAEAQGYAAGAVSVDPLLWFCQWSRSWVALLEGEFETALRRWQDTIASVEDTPIKNFFLAIFSAYAGRLDDACHLLSQFADAGIGAMSNFSSVLKALFHRDAQAAVGLLEDQAVRDYARQDSEMSWWLAAGCSFVGEVDEALHWLANAIDLGFVNHVFFSTMDPFLATLRGNPRFEALMERARQKQQEFGI